MIRILPLRHFDDVGSLLNVLGCLLGSIFLRKPLFSEHGIAKIHLNSIIHATKRAQIGGELGRISAKKVVWMMREAFLDHFRRYFSADKISVFEPRNISKSGAIQTE